MRKQHQHPLYRGSARKAHPLDEGHTTGYAMDAHNARVQCDELDLLLARIEGWSDYRFRETVLGRYCKRRKRQIRRQKAIGSRVVREDAPGEVLREEETNDA